MQDMNQFILPTPAPPTYVLEGADPSSSASPPAGRSYSWSMESDPQLFTNDATFWQDVSSFICSSPQNSFDYRSEDFVCSATSPTSPDEQSFKAIETETGGPTPPRVRGQTLELLLKRRAQNRASQRAYRDRRDQHVRELEAQYEEMAKRNQELTQQHEALCAAHEKLKIEQEAWKAERAAASTEVSKFESGEEELHWRAEACLSQMLSAGSGGGGGGGGSGGVGAGGGTDGEEEGSGKYGGLVVKVVVCKRCFGPQVKAKCEG